MGTAKGILCIDWATFTDTTSWTSTHRVWIGLYIIHNHTQPNYATRWDARGAVSGITVHRKLCVYEMCASEVCVRAHVFVYVYVCPNAMLADISSCYHSYRWTLVFPLLNIDNPCSHHIQRHDTAVGTSGDWACLQFNGRTSFEINVLFAGLLFNARWQIGFTDSRSYQWCFLSMYSFLPS